MKIFVRIIITLSVILQSCGGGIDSSEMNALKNDITIYGTASKGILQGAIVQVSSVPKSITSPVPIGIATNTKTDGSFAIGSIQNSSDPLLISITSNSSTKMLDETKEPVNGLFPLALHAPPIGFRLRTLIPNSMVSQITNISPLTEFATMLAASATKGTSTNNINLSRMYLINTLNGLDPFFTKPVNGNVTILNNDQQKLMLLLIALQKRANDLVSNGNTCKINNVSDLSGLTCLMKEISEFAVMNVSTSGDATFPNSFAFTNYLEKVLQNLENDLSINQSSFYQSVKNQSISFQIVNQVKLIDANNATKLDAFINGIRLGLFNAQQLLNTANTKLINDYNAIVIDKVADIGILVHTLFSQCASNESRTGSLVNGFTCTDINNTLSFTPSIASSISSNSNKSPGNNSYSFVYKIPSSDVNTLRTLEGIIAGGVFPTQGNGSLSFTADEYLCNKTLPGNSTCSKKQRLTSIKINGLANNIQQSRATFFDSASFSLPLFLITQYSINNTSNENIDLSGLNLQINNKQVTGSGSYTYTNTFGDTIKGSITNFAGLIYQTYNSSDPQNPNVRIVPNTANIDLSISTNTLTAIVAHLVFKNSLPLNFNPFINSNVQLPNTYPVLTSTLSLPNNISISLTCNQPTTTTRVYDVKLNTPNGFMDFKATKSETPIGSSVSLPFGVTSDGITVTSSSTFNAKLYEDNNGNLIGNIFDGTSQIGSLANNGLITINGNVISIK